MRGSKLLPCHGKPPHPKILRGGGGGMHVQAAHGSSQYSAGRRKVGARGGVSVAFSCTPTCEVRVHLGFIFGPKNGQNDHFLGFFGVFGDTVW